MGRYSTIYITCSNQGRSTVHSVNVITCSPGLNRQLGYGRKERYFLVYIIEYIDGVPEFLEMRFVFFSPVTLLNLTDNVAIGGLEATKLVNQFEAVYLRSLQSFDVEERRIHT